MIYKGTVIGLSSVRTLENDKKTRIQSICVDIPKKGVDGVNALSGSLFNDSCNRFQIGEEVLCETDRYGQELNGVYSFSAFL